MLHTIITHTSAVKQRVFAASLSKRTICMITTTRSKPPCSSFAKVGLFGRTKQSAVNMVQNYSSKLWHASRAYATANDSNQRRKFEHVGKIHIPRPRSSSSGHDACFSSTDQSVLGVFGATHDKDNKSMRKVVTNAKREADNIGTTDPSKIIQAAVSGLTITCIAVLKGNTICTSNVGDAGLLVFRPSNKQILFRSVTENQNLRIPSDKEAISTADVQIKVLEGDVVLLASNSVFNNLKDQLLVSCASEVLSTGIGTDESLAQNIANRVASQVTSELYSAYASFKLERRYDVTLVVGIVGKTEKDDTKK